MTLEQRMFQRKEWFVGRKLKEGFHLNMNAMISKASSPRLSTAQNAMIIFFLKEGCQVYLNSLRPQK